MDENKENVPTNDEAQASEPEENKEIKEEVKEEEGKKKTVGKEILEWVEAIVIAVLVAMVIRSFVFTVVRVDGGSMNNTLTNNDRLIVWRLGYEPKQGDIVIFEPDIPENEGRNTFNRIYWVKRVIATGGQHVEIDYASNSVFVDGEKLDEPYLPEPMQAPAASTVTTIDVPEGKLFLMGDNRNSSRDCRYIGPVDEDDVVGTAVLRFWPLDSIGGVD